MDLAAADGSLRLACKFAQPPWSIRAPDVETNMREAIEVHREGLRLEGDDVPQPQAYSTYVRVSALITGGEATHSQSAMRGF